MENINKVIQHYISVFKHDSSSISPIISNFFKQVLEKYDLEDILKAINLGFEDLKEKKKPHITKVIRAIEKNLKAISGSKQAQLTNPDSSYNEKVAVSNKFFEKSHENYSFGTWKKFFEENEIPKNIISKKELEKIPADLRDFYIAAVVCDYIYNNLTDEERKKIDKLVENKIKSINITQNKETEEASHFLKRYYIKKLYNIPY